LRGDQKNAVGEITGRDVSVGTWKNWRVSHQLIENSISWHPSRRELVIVCATWTRKVGISVHSFWVRWLVFSLPKSSH